MFLKKECSMYNRKDFIRHAGLAATSLLLQPFDVFADAAMQRLTILHTNDTHSRLDPFPMDGGRNQGLGGVAARAAIIKEIRDKETNVLLLDAGDIFQGTPYFNIYKGAPEIKAMTLMGYDACTMGNHDFDAGLENFALQLQHAQFPVLVCNYDFSGTPMEYQSHPYRIFRKGRLQIGVTGAGIELKGLVPDNLAGGTKYLDPVERVNEVAAFLKRKKQCDLVICLSHLGYQYRDGSTKISDLQLARETEWVDLIIGGHTHTFLSEPVVVKNKIGSDVVVNQVGWGGILLGRLDYEFSSGSRKKFLQAHAVTVGKKTSQ